MKTIKPKNKTTRSRNNINNLSVKSPRRQKIRCLDKEENMDIQIEGWLDGRSTYISFYDRFGGYLGDISGQKLHRLAKAIVRRFEQ